MCNRLRFGVVRKERVEVEVEPGTVCGRYGTGGRLRGKIVKAIGRI